MTPKKRTSPTPNYTAQDFQKLLGRIWNSPPMQAIFPDVVAILDLDEEEQQELREVLAKTPDEPAPIPNKPVWASYSQEYWNRLQEFFSDRLMIDLEMAAPRNWILDAGLQGERRGAMCALLDVLDSEFTHPESGPEEGPLSRLWRYRSRWIENEGRSWREDELEIFKKCMFSGLSLSRFVERLSLLRGWRVTSVKRVDGAIEKPIPGRDPMWSGGTRGASLPFQEMCEFTQSRVLELKKLISEVVQSALEWTFLDSSANMLIAKFHKSLDSALKETVASEAQSHMREEGPLVRVDPRRESLGADHPSFKNLLIDSKNEMLQVMKEKPLWRLLSRLLKTLCPDSEVQLTPDRLKRMINSPRGL